MVNKILIGAVFFVFLIFSACGEGETVGVQERLLKGEFEAYGELARVHCDSLYIDSMSGEYSINDSLFTGVCFTHYPNASNDLENRQIFQGKLHGHRIMFGPKGDTLMLNLYNHGQLIRESIGRNEVCLCDSLEVREEGGKEYRYYFNERYTGRCEKYYPGEDSTQLYIEANYLKGLSHGEMIVYGKDGEVIIREKYLEGEKINQ
jgi:hypothetical protein